MASLITNLDVKSTPLSGIDTVYCIDTSGSTGGNILTLEKDVVKWLSTVLPTKKIIGWNSDATQVNNIDELYSTGGTYPSCFVPLLDDPKCLVIITDGQIGLHDMETFRACAVGKIRNIPIIIIFAISNANATIGSMQNSVNMSIPNGLLSLSNDVLIIVATSMSKNIMLTKGCFNNLKSCELTNELNIYELPLFEPDMLNKINIDGSVPLNLIKLSCFANYIDLNVLYTLDDLPLDVINGIDRLTLPRFNLDILHKILITMLKKYNSNPELDAIRQELFLIANSPDVGLPIHKELIENYQVIRSRGSQNSTKVSAIHKLLDLIAEYKRDNTSFVLGSNRANRAIVFNENELEQLDACSQIECKILLTTGNACILLRCPENENYHVEYTSDYAMEAPFEFGTWLTKLVTPGLFSHELVSTYKGAHPYTREPILGYLPLSFNPNVIMKHMSKLFGDKR